MEKIVFVTDHVEKTEDIYKTLKSIFPECEVVIVSRDGVNQWLEYDEGGTIRFFCMENSEMCIGNTASK